MILKKKNGYYAQGFDILYLIFSEAYTPKEEKVYPGWVYEDLCDFNINQEIHGTEFYPVSENLYFFLRDRPISPHENPEKSLEKCSILLRDATDTFVTNRTRNTEMNFILNYIRFSEAAYRKKASRFGLWNKLKNLFS